MAWTGWGLNTGGGHWASYAVTTGSPSQNKVVRAWDWPPHSQLALRLRMNKTVHLLLIVPAMAFYVVTFHKANTTRWHSWLRHCATSREVTGSIPNGVTGIFHWHNPSGRTMAPGMIQPLTEMSTKNISWGVKVVSRVWGGVVIKALRY
jgi:hypothetical protein